MAVPWPTFFNLTVGAAIHGVFWHNDFGKPEISWLCQRDARGCQMDFPLDLAVCFFGSKRNTNAMAERWHKGFGH